MNDFLQTLPAELDGVKGILPAAVQVILGVFVCVVLPFVAGWLRRRVAAEKNEALAYWVDKAVEAVEQMPAKDLGGEKTGENKKEFVVGFLLDLNPKWDEDVVRVLVEAAVLGMKRGNM